MKKKLRYTAIILTILILTQLFLVMLPQNLSAASPPPKSQKSSPLTVYSQPRDAAPGVYWYQQDNGSFRADTMDGPIYAANKGTCTNPYPAKSSIKDDVDLSRWPALEWEGSYSASVLTNVKPFKVDWNRQLSYEPIPPAIAPANGEVSFNENTKIAIFHTYTGEGYSDNGFEVYYNNPTGCDKYLIVYHTPVKITWKAEAHEEKEIDVEGDGSIQVGSTKQLTARVRTKGYKEATMPSNWSTAVNVSASWDSSNTAIATVSPSTGVVTAKAVGTTTIRATWKSSEYEISDTATIIVTTVPTPPTYTVTGDFDIVPSTINWGSSFSLNPKNFVISAACTYQYHEYKVEKDGSTWTSAKVSSQSSQSAYSQSSYPSSLGVGSNLVTIKITATCPTGTIDSGWIAGKYLNINARENNAPPQFSAGFFKEYNRSGIFPDYEVAIGTRVNLRIIEDPTKIPPWPYDPDGDPITYTWLFADSTSSWIRSLPSEYGVWEHDELHQNLLTTELGAHNITVIARDSFGAETRRNVSIHVIPPNPIPLIDGPTEVKERRPLPTAFSGNRSYSPIGRTITKYMWDNLKPTYATVGTETIKLEVEDSSGLKSLYAATHQLTVLPDEPPVAVVEVDPLGIRAETYAIINKSYSIDGDQIVNATYRYKYDAANDGFVDDGWSHLAGDLAKSQLTPNKVGKYLIELTAYEDYGKTAVATTVLDVVNLAPSVSFLVEGKNEIPEPPNRNIIPMNQILSNWPLYEVNSTTPLTNKPYMWTKDGDKLLAGLGKGMEQQYVHPMSYYFGNNHNEAHTVFPLFTDNGYGPNSISPYRALAARDSTRSGPILVPVKGNYSTSYTTDEDYAALNPAQFSSMIRTNQTHIVFDQKIARSYYRNGDDYTYASPVILGLNKSRIPRYASEISVNTSNPYNVTTKLVHKWLDANPYDYAIELGKRDRIPYYSQSDMSRDRQWQTKAAAGDYSGASSMTDGFPEIPLYEVSGSRIYAVYTVGSNPTYAYYSCCDSDGWSETSYGAGGSRYFDIHTYDLTTGEFLGSSYQNGERVVNPYSGSSSYKAMMKGENLVLIYSQFAANVYFEFDRNGKLVKSGNISLQPFTITHTVKSKNYYGQIITGTPATYVCSWNPHYNHIWKDDQGNFYSYKVVSCTLNGSAVNFDMSLNPEVPQGIYMVQLKSDYTLGGIHKISGDSVSRREVGFYDFMKENNPILFYNPITSEMVTRTYSSIYCSGCMFPTVTEYANVINLNAGTVGNWWLTPLRHFSETFSPGFHVTHSGAYGSGWRTASASGTLDKYNYYANREMSRDTTSITFNNRSTTVLRYGEYAGDGMWLSIYGGNYQGSGPGFSQGGTSNESYMFLDTGTASTAEAYKTFQFGQFVSPDPFTDAEYSFTISMDTPTADSKSAGFSFRMTDPRNRYAVETNGTSISLVKYVNAARTVLDTRAIAMQAKTNYTFKVITQGERTQVSLGGVPYFDKTDSTFQAGKYGPFADKSYVSFAHIGAVEMSEADVNWLTSYAIWEEGDAKAEVRFSNIVFADPEEDPQAGSYQWTTTHTPKFLNNQGLSALHNQTLTSPSLHFDKVGNYRITLRAKDDPNSSYLYPSMTFDAYRKNSNEYWQFITVHRRPVAAFSLSVDPATKYVVWDDTSYDPDRWVSSTNYSTESTGIHYQTTRGVLEKRYYFIKPNGEKVDQKLVTPSEIGTYTVGLQVKDEYGAWSYWNEQEIQIAAAVIPNLPPIPGFTVSPSSGYRGTAFTMNSTASDPEDGARENLTHAYYIRNITEGSAETPVNSCGTCRTSWTRSFSELGVYEIRQVVTDSKGVSAQITKSLAVLNRPPVAAFDWSPKPVWEGDNVTFMNQSSDPDLDALTYSWRILNAAGIIQYTSTSTNPSYRFAQPGTYRVALTAFDGYTQTVKNAVIEVLPLVLEPDVRHTDQWLLYHQDRGHETATHPKDFYSGEQLILSVLGSDTDIAKVEAEIDTIGMDNNRITVLIELQRSGVPNRYEGILYDPVFSSLAKGLPVGMHNIVFQMTYANGKVLTEAVPISIIGHVQQTVNVHRLH